MKTSQKGIDLIVSFEGLKLKAYKCPAGVWTIGVGHTAGVTEGMEITIKEAYKLLRMDLELFEAAITKYITVPVNQNQFDAMVSLCFNIGRAAFRTSLVCRATNRKSFVEAAEAFGNWRSVGGRPLPGLIRRRAAEKALYETPPRLPQAMEPPPPPLAG